jgi:hypothetical protein
MDKWHIKHRRHLPTFARARQPMSGRIRTAIAASTRPYRPSPSVLATNSLASTTTPRCRVQIPSDAARLRRDAAGDRRQWRPDDHRGNGKPLRSRPNGARGRLGPRKPTTPPAPLGQRGSAKKMRCSPSCKWSGDLIMTRAAAGEHVLPPGLCPVGSLACNPQRMSA